MKKLVSLLLFILLFSFCVQGLEFSDVSDNSWYSDYVRAVSDAGIINGTGDGKFNPDGDFTVAQCLAVATRLYSGEVQAQGGGKWYDRYVSYCIENGIIAEGDFDSYERAVTRKEAARIFFRCLDKDSLLPINSIKGIADLPRDDDDYEAVLALYNAGILSGGDSAGAFYPRSSIKRSELSAICARIIDGTLRTKKDLPFYGSPRYLIDDIIMYGPGNGIMSGWKMDNKYTTGNTTGTESATVSADFGQQTAMYRPINKITDGNFRVDVSAAFLMVKDGAYVALEDENKSSFVKVTAKNSEFVIETGSFSLGTGIKLGESISEHVFTFDFSFEKQEGFIIIDGVTFTEIPFDCGDISRLSLGFDGSGRGGITLYHARCVADFRVNENFLANEKMEASQLYGGWQTEGDVEIRQILSERGEDVYSALMQNTSEAKIEFESIGGRVVIEANVLLEDAGSEIKLTSGCLEIYSKQGSYYYLDEPLRHVAGNVWTNIRLEADFTKGEVFIRINGKDCKSHKMQKNPGFTDCFVISSSGGRVWFDDVKVYSFYEYEDYPTSPVSVNDDGYEIGVNVCNLWRNGNCGEGYDAVAPFYELYPYIGLADEGLPELADWEIKQMAEHGIDFQHICWYSPQNVTKAPIKGTQMPQIALNDGYMKSKYGDYVKFCIMWENAGGSIDSREDFEEYVWKYFKEYYFSDDRYYSINNHAVMTIWNIERLTSAFGGVDKAAEVIEFMKEDIKTLGYDGLIILFSGNSSVSAIVSELGGDGLYAYNYGRTGEHADYQIATMNSNKNSPIYYVPAVSVGFNAIGRHDERSGMITPSEHRRVCEYIKNEYIPSENDGSWHDNLLIVSTWNEYTEGTYVAPSNLYGFDYLDNIREVFTEAAHEHEDIIPSSKVKDRLRNIYPDGYSPIRRLRLEDGKEDFDLGKTLIVQAYDFSNPETQKRFTSGHGLNSFGFTESSVYGSSQANDFSFCTKPQTPLMIDVKETGAKYLHIRMKSDVISRGEMFFTTNDITNYTADAKVGWDIISLDDFVDYYVDLSQNPLWSGIITGMRFDPMATAGNFEVELIELLCDKDKGGKEIYFDGYEMKFDFAPEYVESLDDYMVTLNPRLGFFTMSHTTYEYNVDEGWICIEGLNASMKLFIGKEMALINGNEQPLGYTFELRDGLPYVAIKQFMDVFGFEGREESGKLHFDTYDEITRQQLTERKEGQWEFDRFADGEGWTFQNCTGNIYDGALNMVTTGPDTAVKISNLEIDLSKYSKVTVGLMFETDTASPHFQVFFQTKSMSEMNEAASERRLHGVNGTNGQFIEITLDFSDNADWHGILTGLRIDPYHGMGTYSIDYIRLE